jgi:hypothetical protein
VSLDASRHVWALRDAGKLPGGSDLAVLLTLADGTIGGEARTSTRQLAHRAGVRQQTVTRALRTGVGVGAVEVVRRSRGSVPSVFRIPPHRAAIGSGSAPVENNGTASAVEAVDPVEGKRLRTHSGSGSAPPSEALTSPVQLPTYNGTSGTSRALGLVVAVEMRIAAAGARLERPGAVESAIRRRLGSQFGARISGLLDEGVEPVEVARSVLVEDGVGGRCPVAVCGAFDARPITDAGRCSRREACVFYVGTGVELEAGSRGSRGGVQG